MALQQKYEEQSDRLKREENALMSLEHTVESLSLGVGQLSSFIQRVEANFKQNYEQDYAILYA
jgi:hypothetical protein